MSVKKKPKWDRVIIVTLAIIGAICVVDNSWRLAKSLSSAVYNTVAHHQWSTVVIK